MCVCIKCRRCSAIPPWTTRYLLILLIPVNDVNGQQQGSTFFADQITAFEVWIESVKSKPVNSPKQPPEYLPIVLQVIFTSQLSILIVLQALLSQSHRLRCLNILGRFLDLGPWAIHLVTVSLFTHVTDVNVVPCSGVPAIHVTIGVFIH
jgi:regulator-associated protein of mTOR